LSIPWKAKTLQTAGLPGSLRFLPVGVGEHPLDLLLDGDEVLGEVDRVAVALGHPAVVEPHEAGRGGELAGGLGEDDLAAAELVVEPADDLAGELEVGQLVLADGDDVALIEKDVGGLEDGVAEERVVVDAFSGVCSRASL
jgi:hypothetical protein